MVYIEPGTFCTHSMIGMCCVKDYDENNRAIVEYSSKRYSTLKILAHIPPHLLKIINR